MMNNFDRGNEIKLAGIVRESITDGPGIRFAVFCQGCPHHCNGCHNKETWDFENGGKYISNEKILVEIDKNPMLKGVTFSGGEPFCQPEAFYNLALEIEKRKLSIVAFSGYTYEELIQMSKANHYIKLLSEKIDLLIEGRFDIEKRNLSLKFRGSDNQRIIYMKKSIKDGKIALANEYML